MSSTSCWAGPTNNVYSTTYATGSATAKFQVGVDKPFIQVSQYDTNPNNGNVNVYLSSIQGFNQQLLLYFQIVPIQETTQQWGTASSGYKSATVCFSSVDRSTGQTISTTAQIGASGSGTAIMQPQDVVQIQITPSTDPAQAVSGNNMWQMNVSAVSLVTGEWSVASVTIIVQPGCPYVYGISFENAVVNTVNTVSNDGKVLSDADQGRLFFVNGIYWLFYTFNDTTTAPGRTLKDIAWAWSSDGFNWNLLTNPQPRVGRFGFAVFLTNDDFWDIQYDSVSASFICAVAQGAHNNSVDFMQATPDNLGNLTVQFIDYPISGFNVTNSNPNYPSVTSNGTNNVWVSVSTTVGGSNIVETWYWNGSNWTKKKQDSGYTGVVRYISTSGNKVALIENSAASSPVTVTWTPDGGNTWASYATTTGQYALTSGGVVQFNGIVYFALPSSTGAINFFSASFNTSGSSYTTALTAETSLGSYTASNITVQDANHIYVSLANSTSVSLVGTTNGGTNWSSPAVVANTETGIQSTSLHATQSTYNDPSSKHLSVGIAWVDYTGGTASIRFAPVDISNWPSIPTASPINSVIIPHGSSRPLNGFIYPIGTTTTPSTAPNFVLVAFFPPNGDFYGVNALFSNNTGAMSFPQPCSVDKPTPFSVTLYAPASPPTRADGSTLNFPFTTVFIFEAGDGQNNINPICNGGSVLALTIT